MADETKLTGQSFILGAKELGGDAVQQISGGKQSFEEWGMRFSGPEIGDIVARIDRASNQAPLQTELVSFRPDPPSVIATPQGFVFKDREPE